MIKTKTKQSIFMSSPAELRQQLQDMPYTPILKNINRNIFVRYYSDYEYALDFLKSGTMKFNKFSDLRKLDGNRSDITEGESSFILKSDADIVKRYRFRHLDIENDDLNVYCLTYLDLQQKKELSMHDYLKENRFNSGERYAVVINNIDTFLNQIREQFHQIEFDFENGYYDEKFVDYKSNKDLVFVDEKEILNQIFVKRKEKFEDENEFRIVNNHNFRGSDLQLIDCGSIESYAFLVDLESDDVFSSINMTFQFIVELCKLNEIETVTQLNDKLNESCIIIGQAFRDNPNKVLKSLGFPVEEDTENSIIVNPYNISDYNFRKYIKPYIKLVEYSYFTLKENIKHSKD